MIVRVGVPRSPCLPAPGYLRRGPGYVDELVGKTTRVRILGDNPEDVDVNARHICKLQKVRMLDVQHRVNPTFCARVVDIGLREMEVQLEIRRATR